jgi:hypothetical protein
MNPNRSATIIGLRKTGGWVDDKGCLSSWGSGSNRAEIYSSVLCARSTLDLGAGNNMQSYD